MRGEAPLVCPFGLIEEGHRGGFPVFKRNLDGPLGGFKKLPGLCP